MLLCALFTFPKGIFFAIETLKRKFWASFTRFKFQKEETRGKKTPVCVCRARVYALCKRAAGERVKKKAFF
jgi:hypothetical protein